MRLIWLSIFFIGCLLVKSSLGVPAPAGGTGTQGQDEYHEDENKDENDDDYGAFDNDSDNDEDDNDNEDDAGGASSVDTAMISTKPITMDVDLNGQFQLLCEGDLGDSVLIWEKEGQILFVNGISQNNDKRLSIQDASTRLIVTNVTAADSGKYKCSYSTEKLLEVVHTVHVRVAPRVAVNPPVLVLKHGEPATLTCNVTGYPKPTVSWERKNKKMPGGEDKIEGSRVTFTEVTRHHAGIYECFAENSIGSARTALDLQVRYPPEIEVEKESVNTGQGLDADLVCLVHAEPKANVVWYKNGEQIKPEGHKGHELVEHVSHRYILHLKVVTKDDFGKYQCTASNTLGRVNKSILLSGAPSQPMLEVEKSRVLKVGKDGVSYSLVWMLESTIAVANFKLKLRKSNGNWTEEDVTGSEIRPHVYAVNHTVENLIPSTDYEASLMASNEHGWSPESRIYTFHINGKEFQSLEAELPMGHGATAVQSTSGGPSTLGLSYCSTSLMTFALCILSTVTVAITSIRSPW